MGFWLFALILLLSAIGVVSFRNPIRSALCLVVNLLTIAVLFAALNAHFLMAAQIIVYAGAIMVLVIFVLMLLNLKEEPTKRGDKLITVLGTLAGIGFFWLAYTSIVSDFGVGDYYRMIGEGTVHNLARLLFTKFLFPFEFASVLIMVAIVGAVMLGKREKEGLGGNNAKHN